MDNSKLFTIFIPFTNNVLGEFNISRVSSHSVGDDIIALEVKWTTLHKWDVNVSTYREELAHADQLLLCVGDVDELAPCVVLVGVVSLR